MMDGMTISEIVDRARRTENALDMVRSERCRQDNLWGDQSGNHPFEWMSILGEEYGELCEAVNETFFKNAAHPDRGGFEKIVKEAAQVAAVAVAIIETARQKLDATLETERDEALPPLWKACEADNVDKQPAIAPTPSPCYQADTGGECAYQAYDGDDEPIDRCKRCPLCHVDKQRHRQPPNDPLTLEELREMDGGPVWVEAPGMREYGRYGIVAGVDIESQSLYLQSDFSCRDYGKVWLAYRRKPEDAS